MWFTLDPITPYTGSIHVVAGTHRDPLQVVRSTSAPTSSQHVLAFRCEPGDVITFHPWALHSGFGCWPDSPRRTLTIRFLGDDIRWRPTRSYYHEWMAETGLAKGDLLDHPGFPVVWSAPASATAPA